LARFSRTLATSSPRAARLHQGHSISPARTYGNWVNSPSYALAIRYRHLKCTREAVAALSAPLVENPVFPPLLPEMVKIGDETGEAPRKDSLARSRILRDEVDASSSHCTSLVDHHEFSASAVMSHRDHLRLSSDVQDAHARQVPAVTFLICRLMVRRTNYS